MAFCTNCGSEIQGRFCARCGTPNPESAGTSAPPPPPVNEAGAHSYEPPAGAAHPYPPPAGTASAGLNENVASALCYVLGLVTGILFLALAPYNQNRRIRFHAFQSIFFHVAWIIFWIGYVFVVTIMPTIVHLVLSGISALLAIAAFILWLVLIIKAFNGDRLKLPVIGDMAEKQA